MVQVCIVHFFRRHHGHSRGSYTRASQKLRRPPLQSLTYIGLEVCIEVGLFCVLEFPPPRGHRGKPPIPRSCPVRYAKEPESLERLSNSQSALNVRIRTRRTVTDRTRTSLTKELPSAGYTSYDQGSSLSMDMVMALVVHRLSLPIIVGSIWGPANPPTRCINPSSVHGAPSSTNRRPQRCPALHIRDWPEIGNVDNTSGRTTHIPLLP